MMVKRLGHAALCAGMLVLSIGTLAETAWGQTQMPVSLFKVITVKDEVLIGLNTQDIQSLYVQEPSPAGAIASALAGRKSLTVWQYAVRYAANGEREVAPLRQIGLLAHDSLRVEPYSSPFTVVPHE